MIGGEEDEIVGILYWHGLPSGQVRVLTGLWNEGNEGVVVFDFGAFLHEFFHQDERGGLPAVVYVRLVGQTEDEDSGAFNSFAFVVQGVRHFVDDVVRHGGVDFAGQLDEASVLFIFPGFPGKVKGIDGYAVSTEAGSGAERHETEGFGGGGVYDFVHVDTHGFVDDL